MLMMLIAFFGCGAGVALLWSEEVVLDAVLDAVLEAGSFEHNAEISREAMRLDGMVIVCVSVQGVVLSIRERAWTRCLTLNIY